MAQRAARFYLMLGDLARTNDTRPEVFLAHKDALLTHMREFHSELTRFAPLLAAGGRRGRGHRHRPARRGWPPRPTSRCSAAPPSGSRTGGAAGAAWCSGSAPAQHSEAERLQDATITAIANVTALLRRVTESRRGGVSRESQLRHLAQWFAACPSDDDAHALFQAVFGLGAPRHVAAGYDDPERSRSRLSWWEAEPVELSRTLVRTGKAPALHGPGRIQRNDEERQRLRAEQLKATAQRRAAAAHAGRRRRVRPGARRAGDPGAAQPARRGAVRPGAGQPDGQPARAGRRGSAHGVRLTLRPGRRTHAPCSTVRGRLHPRRPGGSEVAG